MVVQLAASAETWSWNAVAYAASQRSTTWLTVAVVPRSTWIHCGSLNALDQRVPAFPSTAAEAGRVAFSVDDAVAGRPWDSRVLAARAFPATNAAVAITRHPTAANTSALAGRDSRAVRIIAAPVVAYGKAPDRSPCCRSCPDPQLLGTHT